jgi:hypothetical protein
MSVHATRIATSRVLSLIRSLKGALRVEVEARLQVKQELARLRELLRECYDAILEPCICYLIETSGIGSKRRLNGCAAPCPRWFDGLLWLR